MYLVFAHTPGGVTVGDPSLCCFVPCLLSAFTSFCLLVWMFWFDMKDMPESSVIIVGYPCVVSTGSFSQHCEPDFDLWPDALCFPYN